MTRRKLGGTPEAPAVRWCRHCRSKHAQDGGLCRTCAPLYGEKKTCQELERERIARSYPQGAYCRVPDPSIERRIVRTGFVPGVGPVEFEVTWNGT